MLPQIQPHDVSITEEYSPKYRRRPLNIQPSKISIEKTSTQINSIVHQLQTIFAKRMTTHEEELIKIMKLQITRMLEDMRKIIKVYNQMIVEKNLSQDLLTAQNEADYFKHQAVRLFEENNVLKREAFELKQLIDCQNFTDNCQMQALKSMARKLHKVKVLKDYYRHQHHKSETMEFNKNQKNLKTELKQGQSISKSDFETISKKYRHKRLRKSDFNGQRSKFSISTKQLIDN